MYLSEFFDCLDMVYILYIIVELMNLCVVFCYIGVGVNVMKKSKVLYYGVVKEGSFFEAFAEMVFENVDEFVCVMVVKFVVVFCLKDVIGFDEFFMSIEGVDVFYFVG